MSSLIMIIRSARDLTGDITPSVIKSKSRDHNLDITKQATGSQDSMTTDPLP